MKKKSIFFIGLMAWAIFGMVLSSCKTGTEHQTETPATTTTSSTSSGSTTAAKLPIAYINTDTLLANYTYFVAASKALAEKEQKANANLEAKGRKLQNQYIAVQKKVQAGELTANQIAQEEQRFANKQQNLQAEQQRIAQEIMQETQEVQDTLYGNLRRVLKNYADTHGYEYVLSYAEVGSPVLIAPKGADITDEILKILNSEGGE